MNDYRDLLKNYVPRETVLPNQDKLPLDSPLPMLALAYGAQFAESIEFNEHYVDLSYSLAHFNLLSDKAKKMLKPVKSKLKQEGSSKSHKTLLQLTFDDNMFN